MRLSAKSFRAAAALGVSLLVTAPAATALAESVDMQVQVGWDGAYKSDAWTSVRVTVTNKDKDLSGNLVIKPQNQNFGGFISSQFVKEVVIPEGGTKSFTIDVPGALLDQSVEVVLENKSGKKVESTSSLGSTPVRQGLLIGGITAKKDDLNFLALLNSSAGGGASQVKYLNPEQIPAKTDVLKGLDLLVINHAPKEKLNPDQIQAIKSWVEQGGSLLLSGGVNYTGGAGMFNDLSPVDVTGTQELANLSGLQAYTGTSPNASKITVSTGQLRSDSQVLIRSGDVPVLVKRQVGSGNVLYAAYDLSEEPLASWQGNKQLWGRVLAPFTSSQIMSGKMGMPAFQNARQLVQASSLFEALNPSLVRNVLIYGGYILVTGPLLYMLLKRWNRREWAWVLIPASAVVFALAIFTLNSNQRAGGAIGQFAAVIDLKSAKTAEYAGAGSFIVTSGGDYTVQFATGSQVYADNGFGPTGTDSARVLLTGDKTDIQYNNVEYWSTRSAYAEGTLSNLGNIESDLQVSKDGQLTGTLSNKTSFDLEDVFIIAGNDPLSIGTIKAGETVTIDKKIAAAANTFQPGQPYPYSIVQRIFPYRQTPDIDRTQQQRSLLQYALFEQNSAQPSLQLFGFSRSPLDIYSIKNMRQKDKSNLSLIRQALPLKFQQNAAVPGLIKPIAVEPEGQTGMDGGGYVITNGSIAFLYDTKLNKGFTADKVTTSLQNQAYKGLDPQIFNWQKNEWETVTYNASAELTGDELKKYLSADGNLWLKLSSSGSGHYFCPVPDVGVEGKVAP